MDLPIRGELTDGHKLWVLGHSDIKLTANLYTHLQKQTAIKAARIMDEIFGRP